MTSDGAGAKLWGVVVTYARPDTLNSMLAALSRQTRPVDYLLVVDNGSDAEVARIAYSHGADYLDSGDNLGPAGGIALGMAQVLARADPNDWILLVDDDNEPADNDLLRQLWVFAQDLSSREERLGGVAAGGSVYRRQFGIFRRLADEELTGTVDLDVLFGGSLPMYSVSAVSEVGPFDADLFWGFEEGEYGLRMRRHGFRLCAPGAVFLRSRELAGTAGVESHRVHTPQDKAAWRRYYSIRNSTVLARRYGGRVAPFITAAGGAAKSTAAMLRAGRPRSDVALAPLGALHGLTGHLGRRVDPGRNSKE
ncbi:MULTISPECIES: glycosyltransferase [unclassified Knoellia]|uniref:glycosyltransferase n=1 Tax=Knoellia altitudinis TaxID=3404795 RepID=UPI00361EC70C